jgi:hypothetical protein
VANRLEPQPLFFRYADRALCEKADVFCTEDDDARRGLKDARTSSAKRSRIFIPESEKIDEVASVESGSMPVTKSERPEIGSKRMRRIVRALLTQAAGLQFEIERSEERKRPSLNGGDGRRKDGRRKLVGGDNRQPPPM